MKRILVFLICLVLLFSLTGCGEPKQFNISLREGLFQGTSSKNSDIVINIELIEIDIMQYVKTNNLKIKDLSTIDTKYYTPYKAMVSISQGINNYYIDYSEMVAENFQTTDTYKMSYIKGDLNLQKIDLANFKMKLVDNDNDSIVDEFKVSYSLNAEKDVVDVKFISEKQSDLDPYHKFQFEYQLTCDENIVFAHKPESLFLAGKQLVFNINKIDGYNIAMYVDNALYKEINSNDCKTVVQFKYATTYKNISIEFKLIKNNSANE